MALEGFELSMDEKGSKQVDVLDVQPAAAAGEQILPNPAQDPSDLPDRSADNALPDAPALLMAALRGKPTRPFA